MGPAGDFAAPFAIDKVRPDVAAFFRKPAAARSGYSATLDASALPPGRYAVAVYRRAGAGWIVCPAPQADKP